VNSCRREKRWGHTVGQTSGRGRGISWGERGRLQNSISLHSDKLGTERRIHKRRGRPCKGGGTGKFALEEEDSD